jgi:hypothetical protein
MKVHWAANTRCNFPVCLLAWQEIFIEGLSLTWEIADDRVRFLSCPANSTGTQSTLVWASNVRLWTLDHRKVFIAREPLGCSLLQHRDAESARDRLGFFLGL